MPLAHVLKDAKVTIETVFWKPAIRWPFRIPVKGSFLAWL